MHQQMAQTMDAVIAEIKRIQHQARTRGFSGRPAWPMIVLRSPKGWTCPAFIDGKKCEDYWRSHQVPMADMDKPGHVRILEGWMQSYRPDELFDRDGRLHDELAALAPKGERRMSDNPHANGGRLLRELRMPDFPRLRHSLEKTRQRQCRGHAGDGDFPARRDEGEPRRAELSACSARTRTIPTAGRMCST